MNRLNIGTIDLPLLSETSLVSQPGLALPSYGEPPMSDEGLVVDGVEAGTVTPAGAPFVPSPTTAA